MFNKSKKAIETLNRQLSELDSISNVRQGNNWKASLKDTLDLYIGPDSSLSTRLDGLYFTRKESYVPEGVIGVFTNHVYDESLKENFKDLINNAIKHIQSNGIFKDSARKNFLGQFGNTEIISGLVVAAGIIYGIGNYFGKLEKDREVFQSEKLKEKMESQIQNLQSEKNLMIKEYDDFRLKSTKTIDSLQNEINKLKESNKKK